MRWDRSPRLFGVLCCFVRLCVRGAVGEAGAFQVSRCLSPSCRLFGGDLGLKWSPNMCWLFCRVCRLASLAKLDGSVEPFKSFPVN